MNQQSPATSPDILLFGATGQVGWELERALAPLGDLATPDREMVDLTDLDGLAAYVRDQNPDLLVNAAAYTDVDGAESDESRAFRLNAEAPRVIAEASRELGIPLIHYSTDYVFDGELDRPYREDDQTNPLGVYGRSKLAGERAVAKQAGRWLIFRTSWVYGRRRSNFLETMLGLADEHHELRVVDDEIGAPTWCRDIAEATAQALVVWRQQSYPRKLSGRYHLTASGSTSWCEFARRIFETWPTVDADGIEVEPIPSEEYPTVAPRPANSVLSNDRVEETFRLRLPDWAASLDKVVDRS
jgi:dTDP-4-dehydrorhamnose reductase